MVSVLAGTNVIRASCPDPMPAAIKVAIVEDDTGVREGLTFVIKGTSGFSCTGSYANAESALKAMPLDWPDVVLMDIHLPKMSGIDCTGQLKEMNPGLHIVMLTAYEDDDLIFKSLQAGASGYLLKRTPPAEIVEGLLDVYQGGSPMTSSIARKVVRHFQQKPSNNELANLSKRELEILKLLTEGCLYKEIGDQLSISAVTVRSHLRNIYEKLHVRTRTEAVVKFLAKHQP